MKVAATGRHDDGALKAGGMHYPGNASAAHIYIAPGLTGTEIRAE
jgi:hypothetical protein